MTLETLAARALEWAATYLLHSTLLLGLVWLVAREVRSDAWREILWRGALLGSIATATLATAIPLEPLGGRWSPGVLEPRAAVEVASGPWAAPADRAGGAPARVAAPAGTVERRQVDPPTGAGGWTLAEGLLAGWAGVAALLLGLLAWRNARVLSRLRDRAPAADEGLLGMLAELRRLAGVWVPVRLSVSPRVSTPLVLGGSEICLPPRFLDGLAEDEQRAALAHELAHVARKDAWWQLGTAILHALLFFQPLHGLARRRLRAAAENLCDDWALRQTGSPLALGRCLTGIASWVSADPLPGLGSTQAMAEGGSPLLDRVRRIADGTAGGPAPRAAPVAAVAALLVVTVSLAPAVGGREEAAVPGPAGSLAERWDAALEAAGPEGLWLGWGIERPATAAGGMVISSTPGPVAGRDGSPLADVLRAAGVERVPDVAFLFGFDSEGRGAADVDWMMIRSADAPTHLGGTRLHWLGIAPEEESLGQLSRLFGEVPLAEVRAEIVAALAVHPSGPAARDAVAAALAAADDEEVRAEAAGWLAHQDAPETAALLERLAREDPSAGVREEATSALVELGDPAAGDALLRLLRDAPDPRVRSEALQRLDGRGDGEAVAAIEALAFRDPVAAVRLEAVDALGAIGTPASAAALGRLAADHPDGGMRRAAVEALAEGE